jgi:ribosomal protein S18 acetylase RimI-like enzyme
MSLRISYLADEPEFVSEVANWYKDFFGEFYPERTVKDWQNFLFINKDSLPFTLIAVEEKNGIRNPIGTATIKKNGMPGCEPNSIWLSGVYVIESARGRGVASALIAQCLKISAELGVNKIMLFTRTDGQLYKKFGWYVMDEVEHQGGIVKVMVKEF